MRDYNYFALVERSKKRRSKSGKAPNRQTRILLVVGCIAVIAWPAITQARLLFLDYKINTYNQVLMQDAQYPLLSVVDQKQAVLASNQTIVSSLREASNAILEKEVINEELLHVIATVLPSDTQLIRLSISGRSVKISGAARSRAAIAELLYNLRNTGYFGQQLFVNSLNESDGVFPFDLNLELAGGGI